MMPFKCLHWNVDDAFVKIKIFITTGVLKGCDSYLFIKLCKRFSQRKTDVSLNSVHDWLVGCF